MSTLGENRAVIPSVALIPANAHSKAKHCLVGKLKEAFAVMP